MIFGSVVLSLLIAGGLIAHRYERRKHAAEYEAITSDLQRLSDMLQNNANTLNKFNESIRVAYAVNVRRGVIN